MKRFVPFSILWLILAGCIWDRSSVEPRSVLRIDRNATENKQAQQGVPDSVPNQGAIGFGVVPSSVTQPVPSVTSAVAIPTTGPASPTGPPAQISNSTGSSLNSVGARTPASTSAIIPPRTPSGVGSVPVSSATVNSSSLLPGTSVGTITPSGGVLGTGTSSSSSFGTSSPGLGSGLNTTQTGGATTTGTGLNSASGSSLGLSGTSAGSSVIPALIPRTNNILSQTNLFGPR